MRIQSVRLFIHSSLAILALTLVWGFGQIPNQGELAEDQVRQSLEQELGVLRGAVRAAVDQLRLRTLDILKNEPESAKRAIGASSLAAVGVAEWSDSQWRVSNFVTKHSEFNADAVRGWLANWGLDKLAPEDAHFNKVAEIDGRAYYALITRVRKGDQTAYALGIFAANDFPLSLPADRVRDISVFDAKGTALALNHSAYVGANLRRQPLVSEILESDVVNVRTEWTNERRQPMIGVATKLGDTNLYAAVEAKAPLAQAAVRQAWIYLLLSAAGALAVNWALFAGLVRPLFAQLAQAEAQVVTLRRVLSDAPEAPAPVAEPALVAAELPSVDFIEDGAVAEPPPPPAAPETSLAKIVNLALRSHEVRMRELDVTVDRIGLDEVTVTEDVLQLQTAIEEIVKNALEAMSERSPRRLSITAHAADGRVRLSIEDSGPGVAPEAIPRIFEPFFTTRAQAGGVARGLGLNVVRRIIEAMGGAVTARNLNGGAGFACQLTWPRHAEIGAVRPAGVSANDNAPEPQDLALLADEDDDFAQVPTVHRPGRADDLIRRPRVRTLE